MESLSQIKIILLFTSLIFLSAGCRKNIRQRDAYTFNKQEKELLREGDIILRKGKGAISQIITNYLADTLPISHCGILIQNQAGWQVIHSLAKCVSDQDGVQLCSLDQFTQESIPTSLKIVRYKEDSLHILASQALYYLTIHKPFDTKFNIQDTSAFFCSQLPLHILKYHLHSSLKIGENAPSFSLFLNETYFQLIYSSDHLSR